MYSRIGAQRVSNRPKLLMTWKVATCVVTPGTRVAIRKRAMTSFLKRKSKRSMAYAVIEPISTVPVIENNRMKAVLPKAISMWPSLKAVT